jgi:NADH:ubiquinone oxidoreductase subunit 6 (subunit J)
VRTSPTKNLGFGMIGAAVVLAALWLSIGATPAVVLAVLVLVGAGVMLVR